MTASAAPEPGIDHVVAAVPSSGRGFTGAVLTAVAQNLQDEGYRLAGVVQTDLERIAEGPCDTVLAVLPAGTRIDISQNLGPLASGCRLDQQALEDAVGLVDPSLDERTQLLVINKFGKREAEGAGFRQTIARAVERGIPVVLGIGPKEREALEAYIGEGLAILPDDEAAILSWCRAHMDTPSG
jgi:hypothetical protein